ncbi:nucleoside monophosphate kinase [bacterium]|nr:nucleoside monophosphate kinase [bacterium]
MKTILFHGQAGSGKDTQVEKLLEKFPVERIATGAMFRTMSSEGDPDAVKAMSKVDNGIWPTPEETYALVGKWFSRFDNSKDWVLVSVARYAEQIPFLDEALKPFDREVDLVIHFVLSEEVALERLAGRKICAKCQATYHPKFKPEKVEGVCDSCGSEIAVRVDDMPEKIKERFAQYAKTITPYLDEYKSRGILVEIDASGSIENIHQEVVKALDLK